MKIAIVATIMLLTGIYPANATSCAKHDAKSISIVSSKASGSPKGPEIQVSATGDLLVRMVPNNGAEIDLTSVRVRYGFFDITKKVADQVGEISAAMDIAGDLLPVGEHRISIKVRDNVGHTSTVKLTLAVTVSTENACPLTLTAAKNFARQPVSES